MDILLVGAGVIGTVYGAHLAAAGHQVHVLTHGQRTRQVADRGLRARDASTGVAIRAQVRMVDEVGGRPYDLVLVTVRRELLAPVVTTLGGLAGKPTVLVCVNNPDGRKALAGIPGTVCQGFPGLGGVMIDGTVDYLRTSQQPTTVEATDDPRLAEFCTALTRRGFAVRRTDAMDGWLTYHAAWMTCFAAVLRQCGNDPVRLAGDRSALALACRAMAEGLAALRAQRVPGLPWNLALLLGIPLLRPVAVRYLSHLLRSPMGELCIAGHARHAGPEIDTLARDVLARVADTPKTRHLHQVLRSL